MRKNWKQQIFLGLFSFLFLISCNLVELSSTKLDVPVFNSYQEAFSWIDVNIHSKYEINDRWKRAAVTLKTKEGDCDNFAILALEIIYQQFGEKGVMAVQANFSTSYGYPKGGHAYAKFERCTYNRKDVTGFFDFMSYTYDTAIMLASKE